MEVTNRLKGLELIDRQCLKNYGQRFVTLCRRQGSRPSPKKEMQKGRMVSEETLQLAENIKAKEKRKDIPI